LDNGSNCKMSVDGTDCRVKRPKPDEFRKYYSHKFKGAGLRYEVALCIQTGDIVWVNGPFPCGHHPDINIFLQDLATLLDDGERVEADDGYRGWPKFVDTPKSNCADKPGIVTQKKQVRARHEHVNSRLKTFKVLADCFRQSYDMHGLVFRSVAIITQISFETGNPLPSVFYLHRVISANDENYDASEEDSEDE